MVNMRSSIGEGTQVPTKHSDDRYGMVPRVQKERFTLWSTPLHLTTAKTQNATVGASGI